MNRDIFFKEVIKIADEITARAEKDGNNKVFWKTMSYDVINNKIELYDHQDIYSGASGIMLFLLEVYKISKEKKYLSCAEKAGNWLLSAQNSSPLNLDGMHTGNLGVAYSIFKLHKVSNKMHFFHEGQKLLVKNLEQAKKEQPGFELLNGRAGVLLALLNILNITGFHKEIIPEIEYHLSKFIENIKIYHPGIYWDLYNNNVKPLCGYSHGVSGIAHVFLELFHCTKNPTFKNIAKLAIKYEDAQFDKLNNNWPDYRINIYTEAQSNKAVNEFLEGNPAILNYREDFVAWCHGAVGIGMMRTRAKMLLATKEFDKKIKQAVLKTISALKINTQSPNNTICHGDSGCGLFMLEASNIFGSNFYKKSAFSIAENILRFREVNGQYHSGFYTYEDDFSLFSGNAGIGYFLLKLLYGNKIDDLVNFGLPLQLKFKANTGNFHFLNLKMPELKKYIFLSNYNYPRQFMNSIAINKFRINMSPAHVSNVATTKAGYSKRFHKDLTRFHVYADNLKYKIANNASMEILQGASQILSNSNFNYSSAKFKKYNYVGLFQSNFDHINLKEEATDLPLKKYYYVLYPNKNYEFNKQKIEILEYVLLKSLGNPKSINELAEILIKFNSEFEKIPELKQIIENYLKSFLKISLIHEIKMPVF